MSYRAFSSVSRLFVGEDDNVGPGLQVEINMLGPTDEDVSGITPEDSTEDENAFGIQFQDEDDAVVFIGEPYRICVMLEKALELAREVAREQEEDK